MEQSVRLRETLNSTFMDRIVPGLPVMVIAVGLGLSGCAVATALPGTLVETVSYLFKGEEAGVTLPMRPTLAATQLALRKLDYHVDILEVTKEGYAIGFGEDKLQGRISLARKTDRLSTIFVRARERIVRNASVEKIVLSTILEISGKITDKADFDDTGYMRLYKKPAADSMHVGLYRRGAKVAFREIASKPDWMQISMPSGGKAYMRRLPG